MPSRILLIFFLILFEFSAFTENLTRQQQWNAMAEEVDQWTDGLGKQLDPGIKEVVIALNLLGVKTRQSCEGHLDEGNPFPWVTFEMYNPEIASIRQELFQICTEIDKEEKSENFDEQRLNPLYTQQIEIGKNLSRSIYQMIEPLHLALEKFYHNHSCPYENMLLVDKEGAIITLINNDAERYVLRTSVENERKLIEYRKEMQAFAEFLKEEFLRVCL